MHGAEYCAQQSASTQPITPLGARRWRIRNGILPVMEEVRRDVWAIGGYNGTGNVVGAIYGRMVAQMAVTWTARNAVRSVHAAAR